MISPKPFNLPNFAAEAALRRLQANAWVLRRSMSAMQNGKDLLDFRLHGISQPMLIVWGSVDELIPLSVGERIHESVPHSVLDIVEGCGHLAPAECCEAGDRGYGGVFEGGAADARWREDVSGWLVRS